MRIKEKSNGAEYISVSQKTKSCIHKDVAIQNIPGDTTLILSFRIGVLAQWLGEEKKNLSKQRKLSLAIAKNYGLALPEVHGFMCFLQKLIYVALFNGDTISIPHVGVFSTIPHKDDCYAVRFQLYR